jgi:CBS domain-containing protein
MTTTAAEIMTSPAITVLPEATVAEIASLLSTHHISAVPVCRADGALAGLVSESDVIAPFRESVRQRLDWWIGIISEGETLSQQYLDYLRRDTRTANDIMSRSVVTADPDASVPALAELMVSRGARRLPIVRDGRVVGMVSRSDLVRAISRAPAMLI